MNAVTTIRCALRLLVNIRIILAHAGRTWDVTDKMFIHVLGAKVEITCHYSRAPLNSSGHQDDRGRREGRQPTAHRLYSRFPRTGAQLADLLDAALNFADEHCVRFGLSSVGAVGARRLDHRGGQSL